MYVNQTPRPTFVTIPARIVVALGFIGLFFGYSVTASAQPQVIRNITQATQRLELTVNTSRILTLDKRVPKMVVNNPELVSVTPISANQVQIAAKKPGVTQINLWDEDDQVYTVDLTIYGDVRELQDALTRLFPESSVKVLRLTNSLVLEGFVERPEAVSPIIRLAEDYAPKVVNNITVGGVQQVLLKVKVMEVSRTKLRRLGVDWANGFSDGSLIASSVSGLISSATSGTMGEIESVGPTGGETFKFVIREDNNAFFGFLEALQENGVSKILADPTLTAVSGRPAQFNVGGEVPVPVPSGLGQVTIEYRKFGTQVDFVPIVLGNGNIRLEVRPKVSSLDPSIGVTLQGGTEPIPGFRTREVDTAVELKAGQTLALAGLIETKIEATERGLPFFSDLPLIGSAFRSVQENVNEIELLILVTPEFAGGLEPHEVPQCGPGMETVSPSNCQLYWGGHLEVPSCGQCGPNGFDGCGVGSGCQSCGQDTSVGGAAYISDGVPMQSGVESIPMNLSPQPNYYNATPESIQTPTPNLEVPQQTPPVTPQGGPSLGPEIPAEPTAGGAMPSPLGYPRTVPWSPQQQQTPIANPYSGDSYRVPITAQRPRGGTSTPGLMGPIGYDVE